jgi:hypothetical protein
LSHQSKLTLIERLDADDYDTSETITFAVPLSMPYGVDYNEYERVNGEFEHNGNFYKLVKQKFQNDTLFVVCVNDKKEKKLVSDLSDYVKLTNDLPSSSQPTSKLLLNSFTKDYVSHTALQLISEAGWILNFTFIQQHSQMLLINSLPILSPPPDFIC